MVNLLTDYASLLVRQLKTMRQRAVRQGLGVGINGGNQQQC